MRKRFKEEVIPSTQLWPLKLGHRRQGQSCKNCSLACPFYTEKDVNHRKGHEPKRTSFDTPGRRKINLGKTTDTGGTIYVQWMFEI